MGRGGRAPCCDKSKVKRGPWSPAEDLKLTTFIQKHGHENWRALPKQAGLLRCGKSCRLRWINYLRPDVKRGNFTIKEEDTIIRLHQSFGNKWSKIASYFPGRTDNEIKNVWNTHLKKRLMGSKNTDNSHRDELTKESSMASSSSSSSTSFIVYPKRNTKMAASDQEIQDLSPVSSTVSNISNPGEANISGKEEKMGSMFNHRTPNPNFDVNDTLHEVNKPGSLLDVSLESDIDFWDMIDDLSTFTSNNDEIGARQNSKFGDEYTREVENEKWLRYLENELGLEENQENLAKDKVDEIQFKPEIDEAMACFQMWPSWLQNSVI